MKLLVRSLFMLVLSLVVTTTHAQVFSAGVLAGVSTSQVAGDQLSGYDKFGASAGAFVRAQVSDPISVEFDMLYVSKGSRKIADTDNGDFSTYSLRFQYIEIPILAKYKFESAGVQVGLGPYAGIELSAEEEFNGSEIDISDLYNDLDIGVVASVDYSFSDNVLVELRFSQSALAIRDFAEGSNNVFFDGRQYHSVLQLMMGYQF